MPSHKAWLRLGVPSAPSGLPVLWATQNPPRAAVLTGRVSYRERSQIETSHRKTRARAESWRSPGDPVMPSAGGQGLALSWLPGVTACRGTAGPERPPSLPVLCPHYVGLQYLIDG